MNYRIGEAEKSSWGFFEYVPFVLGGGVLAYGLYLLLKPKPAGPGQTEAADVAPTAAPSKYANFAAVATRFTQVKELYRMGYLDEVQAMGELRILHEEALLKAANSMATRAEADGLIAQMQSFSNDIGNNLLTKGI